MCTIVYVQLPMNTFKTHNHTVIIPETALLFIPGVIMHFKFVMLKCLDRFFLNDQNDVYNA